MLRIQVEKAEVSTRTGTSKRTGQPYTIREQECWVHTCDRSGVVHPHPERVVLMLDDNQAPYPAGSYTICPSSLYVDRFRQLDLRLRLKPVTAATVAASRAA